MSIYGYVAKKNRGRALSVAIPKQATDFITITGISNTTQKEAILTLVKDLHVGKIWKKFKAIYPFVGGSATTHKFNLKDPRDLDAAYRLTFNGTGSVVHASTGVTFSNLNSQYADTFINARNDLTFNSTHISFYSRTSTPQNYCEIGVNGTFALYVCWGTSQLIAYDYDSGVSAFTVSNSSGTGLYTLSRKAANSHFVTKNGVIAARSTAAHAITQLPNSNVLIGGNGVGYTSRECAFASVGDGLTEAEAIYFYNVVQAYQTKLSRGV